MGIIILLVLFFTELFFLVWSVKSKKDHKAEKSITTISEAIIFILLSLTGVIEFGFRYYGIAILLAILVIISIVNLISKKEKEYKTSRNAGKLIGKTLLYMIFIFPAILFPQYKNIEPSGQYDVGIADYVYTDTSRLEEYSTTGENRTVSVKVYYPLDAEGKFPLAVFSHGAFGFSMSNHSTFEELASNGYIVASINHPYHAFYDNTSYGRLVTVDPNVITTLMSLNGKDETQEEFDYSKQLLKLRVDDMNFVVDTLKQNAENNTDEVMSLIDTDKIGLFGHSLGGATSAELGRERNDIDAVIVIDGTLLGDELDFVDDKLIITTDPYPVPMLDIFGENHYNDAQKYADMYPNLLITKYTDKVQNVVLLGTGHLNMTDLPLFSPILAKYLGTGTVDSRECIENMNTIIREYFDWQLKGKENPELKGEY